LIIASSFDIIILQNKVLQIDGMIIMAPMDMMIMMVKMEMMIMMTKMEMMIMMVKMEMMIIMAPMGCTQIPISTSSHIWVPVRLYGTMLVTTVIAIIIIMIIKSEGVNAQL